MNTIGLVGKIYNVEKIENDNVKCTIAVIRNVKNEEGIYETDFIPVILKNNIAKNFSIYCQKGDTIAIKGSLQNQNDNLEIIADKLSFLSSKSSFLEDGDINVRN